MSDEPLAMVPHLSRKLRSHTAPLHVPALSAPPQEFISLRQMHDEQLVRSAELGRRCSLLDDKGQGVGSGGSVPQIMSQLRLRLSLASGSWPGGSVTSAGSGANGRHASGDMAGKHVAVRFAFGPPSEPGSGPQVLDSALGSGSVGSAGSEGTLRLRSRYIGPPTPGSAAGNGACNGEAPCHGGLNDAKTSASSQDEGAALVAGRPSTLTGISEGEEGVEAGAADAGTCSAEGGTATAHEDCADVAASGSVFTVMPSPFSGSGGSGALSTFASGGVAAAPPPPLALGAGSMSALSSGDGGKAAGAGPGGGLEWDELAEPFPLIRAADAAQFYTVLIVDEALEHFSAR